jgi:hypothetical protein
MGAAELLRDDATVASVVCKAAESLLDEGWRLWEPETIWLELHRKHDIDLPLGNRQQLMAGRNLLLTGRFFYDGLVFDRSCAAFANEVLDIEGFDDTHVAHLAWGVDEGKKLSELFEDPFLEFDREVIGVTALQLWEEGFVVAPQELEFAQAALDGLWPKTDEVKALRREVKELWPDVREHPLKEIPFPETQKGVQMARLASVEVFLAERRAARAKQLAKV